MPDHTTDATGPTLLGTDELRFIQDPVSIIVATRNARNEPHLMRALGCRVEDDGRRIVVLLTLVQALALVDDVADNGRIAVIFCRPTTDRGLQLKGADARCVPLQDDDGMRMDAYRTTMIGEFQAIGYPPAFTRAMLARPGTRIIAIAFTPLAAYQQSPGPGAGALLGAPPPSGGPGDGTAPELTTPLAVPPRSHRLTAGASPPDLARLRHSFEGATPCVIATCSAEGEPNVTYLSQFEYVDARTAGASFQFFNKTRRNLLTNGIATMLLLDPQTAAFHRIAVSYLHTEYEGPLFERMRARLASIASHTGMAGVFRLRGADVYRVHDIEDVPGEPLLRPEPPVVLLGGLHRVIRRLAPCRDLDALWRGTLAALADELAIEHALLLMADPERQRLYTVASHGYPASGVGSEVAYGTGVIGVCASVRVPIRLTHVTQESIYGQAIVDSARQQGDATIETRIELPGLYASGSRLAVPILVEQRLIGVLYVESAAEMRFTFETEEALDIVAMHLGLRTVGLSQAADIGDADGAEGAGDAHRAGDVKGSESADAASVTDTASSSGPLPIRHFAADDSVFVDGDYLIKGVAGAIFRKLVAEYRHTGRTRFTNRELRLDPSLRLPGISDNLEARLILLARRLVDRSVPIRIERTGRGRFSLRIDREPELIEIGAGRPPPTGSGR